MAAPADFVPAPFRVVDRRQDTADTWTLELEPRIAFEPGQFTMLSAGGAGEVPISISGDPTGGRLVHTVRAVGLATSAICAAEPGRVLGVRGPFGIPWPTDASEGADVVIVAGGDRPRAAATGDPAGGRAPSATAASSSSTAPARPTSCSIPTQLAEWDARGDRRHGGPRLERPRRRRHEADRSRGVRPGSAVAMLCGPEVMMRFAVPALAARGVSAERTFVSLERNMQCGIGQCGHCQLGPTLICRDGPVYRYSDLERWLAMTEL